MAVVVHTGLASTEGQPATVVFPEATDYRLDPYGADIVLEVVGAEGKRVGSFRYWSAAAIVDDEKLCAFAANAANVAAAVVAEALFGGPST